MTAIPDPPPDDNLMRERVRRRLGLAHPEPHMGCLIVIALLVLLASMVSGCAGPVPVLVHDAAGLEQGEAAAVVEDACGMLELECDIRIVDSNSSAKKRGAVLISLVDVDATAPIHGTTLQEAITDRGRLGDCKPALWVSPNAPSIAHEIGHVLGLEHRDPDNNPDGVAAIMAFPAAHGADIVSDAELDAVAAGAETFTRWCS